MQFISFQASAVAGAPACPRSHTQPLMPLHTKPSWTGPNLSLSLPLSCPWLPVSGAPPLPFHATQHSHSCHHCLTPQLLPAQLAPHITWASFLQICNCCSRHTFLCVENTQELCDPDCHLCKKCSCFDRDQCWSACLNLPTTPGLSQEPA